MKGSNSSFFLQRKEKAGKIGQTGRRQIKRQFCEILIQPLLLTFFADSRLSNCSLTLTRSPHSEPTKHARLLEHKGYYTIINEATSLPIPQSGTPRSANSGDLQTPLSVYSILQLGTPLAGEER